MNYLSAGNITLSLRLITGWTYFSAFWRRLVLENKLDPDEAGYIGEKFNHFLPNALGIGPIIEYLVTHPESLWWAMLLFTLVEGVAGLFFMLGLFTRWMALIVFFLAMGILLGSGWLGTTCLDEWQIGILGIASGFTLFLSGGGTFSLDSWLSRQRRGPVFTKLLRQQTAPFANSRLSILLFSLGLLSIALFTNQYFHGGVYGTLHNKSVWPKLEISNAGLEGQQLSFQLYRTEGADVYGSFLIGIAVKNEQGDVLWQLRGDELADLPASAIENYYVAKVKPGKHSLVIPLGAKAVLRLPTGTLPVNGPYQLHLEDISGLSWTAPLER